MSVSTKKRLPRGEAKLIVEQWCNDYVRDHNGAKPTYTDALKGSGVAPMTFSKPWDSWKAEYDAKQSAAPANPPEPLVPMVVPPVIADAWAATVAALEAAKIRELEVDKISVRRELHQVTAEKTALATELAEILADCEEIQEEFEQERVAAAAALSSATVTISERDAAIVAKEAELVQAHRALAVQEAELKVTKDTAEKLEKSLERAVADERAAHMSCEKTLADLAEVQVLNTRLSDELAATKSALTAAEAAQVAKDKKLESVQGKLDEAKHDVSQRIAELSGASATISGLREQLTAAEARTEQMRQWSDTELSKARERIVELERELAGFRPPVQS